MESKKKIITIYDKYKKAGLIPFSFKISSKANGKKELKNMPSFISIEKYDNVNINKNMGGLGVRMGTKQKNNMFVIGVDIDNKDDDDKYLNGLIKWNQLLKEHNFNSPDDINTPTQKTGNDGYHYLFLVNEEQINFYCCGIPAARTTSIHLRVSDLR